MNTSRRFASITKRGIGKTAEFFWGGRGLGVEIAFNGIKCTVRAIGAEIRMRCRDPRIRMRIGEIVVAVVPVIVICAALYGVLVKYTVLLVRRRSARIAAISSSAPPPLQWTKEGTIAVNDANNRSP